MMLVIAFPLCVLSIYQFEKYQLFRNLQHRFSEKNNVQLKIPVSRVAWVKKGKEILFDGRMFDVKHIVYTGNDIIVTGFFDTEEDKINDEITNNLVPEKDAKKDMAIWQLLHLFAGGPPSLQSCYQTFHYIQKQQSLLIVPGLPLGSLLVPTPPPLS